jgi:UDP-N-acetylmuramoyl-L-alanyl-D-glutamate--2,6-diaminopimelate ligase
MTLEEILEGVTSTTDLPAGMAGRQVAGLDYDSRRVEKDYLFFAFAGAHVDGGRFASQARDRGAVAVVSEASRPDGYDGPWIQVPHGRRAMALAARRFYGAPDARLGLTAITGTNGKTTTAYLVDSILREAGRITAMVGTIEYHLAGRVLPARNTTPESLDLYRIFHELEAAGGSHATLEVSSHALDLGRVHGIQFHTAVFTNLTQDHLDYHGTMERYFAAKLALFEGQATPGPRFAVLNADDPYGSRISPPPTCEALTYGIDSDAQVRASRIVAGFSGLKFEVDARGRKFEVVSPMTGRMNVYNILAACSAALSYSIGVDAIQRGIAACRLVAGRFEQVEEGQPFLVVVDYAHTDDALRNVIRVARGLHPRRVITLFGCGGDRDRNKRPKMGEAAAELSDMVVLTSDNPRSEDPLAIMNDALVGLRRHEVRHIVEPDRARAIRKALEAAAPGDVVILAGKGHETYQVLKDRTIEFDDREVARGVLRDLGYGDKRK